jgi:hypothetical protein
MAMRDDAPPAAPHRNPNLSSSGTDAVRKDHAA